MNARVCIPVRAKKLVQRISQVTPTAAAPTSAPAAANRCLPTASTTGLASGKPCRCWLAATRNAHAPNVYNSTRNATASIVSTQLVRITHPFHPFRGRQLVCVGERYNRYGTTLLLQIDDRWVDGFAPFRHSGRTLSLPIPRSSWVSSGHCFGWRTC
jgi:hypothetical protein